MRQSTRLIFNTSVTYSRMVVTSITSLIATRWLIRAVGVVDFGLFGVLGASGALLTTLTMALTASAQRHLSYEVGIGDRQRLVEVYNTTAAIFFTMAVVVGVVGLALSGLVVRVLDIPPGREGAAWYVFVLTVLGVALRVVMTPFVAIVEAHQAMGMTAVMAIFDALSRLGAVVLVFLLPGDRLVNYVGLLLAGTVAVYLVFAVVCVRRFSEARLRVGAVRRSQVRRIFSFATWTFLGSMIINLRMQGSALMLNLAFGPIMNATYAIAVQVSNYQHNLASAIVKAARPAIVGYEARGQRGLVRRMLILVSKYPFLMVMFVVVPIQFECEAFLKFWLVQVPPMAPLFVRLTTVWVSMVLITYGHNIAMQAVGDIGRFTRWTVLPDIGVLVLTFVWFFVLGWPAWTLPMTSIAMMGVQLLFVVWYVGRRVGLDVTHWLREAVMPVVLVVVVSGGVAGIAHVTLAQGLMRLVVVTVVYAGVGWGMIWWVALQPWEKNYFRQIWKGGQRRWRGRSSGTEPM